MSKKEALSEALRSMLTELSSLDSHVPRNRRHDCGSYAHWSPKDLLAHAAVWTDRHVKLLVEVEPTDDTEESVDENRVIFERHKNTVWDELRSALEHALSDMLQVVDRRADESFTEIGPNGDGNPTWVGIAYYGIAHNLIHLTQALVRADSPDAAIQLQRRMTPSLLQIDSSAAWEGTVELYMARVLSIAGLRDKAATHYKKAVSMNPSLASHAADEPDLAAIRDLM